MLVVVLFGAVGCDVADDALDGAVAGVDDDALGPGDGGVHAAELADVDEPVFGDVAHGHGDFVGVGGEHDAGRAALVEDSDAIAVGVGKGFIGETPDVIEPDALSPGFVPGGTRCVHKGLQELQRSFTHAGHLSGWLAVEQTITGELGCLSDAAG